MEAVTLWINRKPNKEFDLQMTGSQEVLFWYECTIISLQFFINLIRRKYFRIQASMNRGTESVLITFYIFPYINSSIYYIPGSVLEKQLTGGLGLFFGSEIFDILIFLGLENPSYFSECEAFSLIFLGVTILIQFIF